MTESKDEKTTNELAQHINIRNVLGEKTINPQMSEQLKKIAQEGIVFLENNGILPLESGRTVSVFGRSQYDYFYVGYGSGGEVNPPYTVNVVDGLKNQQVSLNEELLALYQAFSQANQQPEAAWGQWPRHLDELVLTDQQVEQARQQSDLAIVILGRAAGEDRENLLEPGSYYLTEDEKGLLAKVKTQFEDIILVINSGNIIDLSWVAEYNPSALVFAWQGGMESGNALAELLTGKATPSGKLPDTIARHYEDYPSAQEFGKTAATKYIEDIYVGYRYFETVAPQAILYPFGYGLSYTNFAYTIDSKIERETIHVQITVKNTGTYPGKEVLQLYVEAPQGKLGKPRRALVAFDKTQELAPGQKETLTFELDVNDFASYDDACKTQYPFAYVLEEGDYRLYLSPKTSEELLITSYHQEKIKCVRQLAQRAAPYESFERMIPVVTEQGLRMETESVYLNQRDLKQAILTQIEKMLIEDEEFLDTGVTVKNLAESLTEAELEAVTRGQGPMDSDLGPKGNAGAFGGILPSLRDKGIPPVITTDGPAGLRVNYYTSLLPCGTNIAASWNTSLLEEVGTLFGKEVATIGSHVILAPGMNIHRNPLGGRNFEYYSEDPLLTGKMAASYIRGVQSQGVATCPKHFACNSQETNRNRNDSQVSERALREIYLKGFEICVKESNPLTLMTAYNKVNGVWAHYHYELVTEILRQEWGFTVCVLTDWWMQKSLDPNFPSLSNNAYRVRAQVDVLMPGGQDYADPTGDDSLLTSLNTEGGITRPEIIRSAVNVLKLINRLNAH